MRDWVRPPRSAQSENRQGCGMTLIDVLVFDGCEALDVLGPYEVIAYGGLDVRAVTRTERRLVRTSQGLELAAEAPRDGAERLIVPCGAWDARHANPRAEAASGAVGAFARAQADRRRPPARHRPRRPPPASGQDPPLNAAAQSNAANAPPPSLPGQGTAGQP